MEQPPATSSVAIAHHWMMSMRGGEKMLAVLAEMFPQAPIYTLLARRSQLELPLAKRDVRTSWLQNFIWIPNLQRKILPLLATASQSLDATEHDVVICSDAAIIKAIRTRPDALKICYCHSPMRYIWDLYDQYLQQAGWLSRLGLRAFASRLREADRLAAQSVTAFVANSAHVAKRIARHYGRTSVVIPPPVDTDFPEPPARPENFYLVVGECVGYKRHDLAIQACTRLKRPLVVIGTGPMLPAWRKLAGPNVRFLGWQSDAAVREHMRHCRALLFGGEEDFGLVPVETQAAGRPVIAYGCGGVTETVREGCTGLFFTEQTAESVTAAIEQFEANPAALWTPRRIQEHAQQFSTAAFRTRFMQFYHSLR